MTLDETELNETDAGIIRLLGDGRASPRLLASKLDRQQPYISQRIKRLVEHGHVRRIDRGLYELKNPPGESTKKTNYRERAINHYGGECQVCSDRENILVHHRDGDRSNNDLDNLIPLCESCHGKVHGRSNEVPELVKELGHRPREPGDTSIRVTGKLADELYDRKGRGGSYEDVIWRLIEQAEGIESSGGSTNGTDPSADRETHSADTEHTDPDAMRARMEEQLSDMDVPGRPAEVERARREAIKYAWERLRVEGSMKPREIANDTFGQFFEHPELGYSTSTGRYAGYQFWDNCLRAALKELPGVHQSGRTWVFREEE